MSTGPTIHRQSSWATIRPERLRELSLLLIIVLAGLFFSLIVDNYLTGNFFVRVSTSVAITAILAAAQTIVLLTRNVVWGLLCGGLDCPVPWNARTMSATSDGEGDTVVWGTSDGETDTVVWGTSDAEGDTVVWGTSCGDASCEPVLWNGR